MQVKRGALRFQLTPGGTRWPSLACLQGIIMESTTRKRRENRLSKSSLPSVRCGLPPWITVSGSEARWRKSPRVCVWRGGESSYILHTNVVHFHGNQAWGYLVQRDVEVPESCVCSAHHGDPNIYTWCMPQHSGMSPRYKDLCT